MTTARHEQKIEATREEKPEENLNQPFSRIHTLPNGDFLLLPEGKKAVIIYDPLTKTTNTIPTINHPQSILVTKSDVFYTFDQTPMALSAELAARFPKHFTGLTQLPWPTMAKHPVVTFAKGKDDLLPPNISRGTLIENDQFIYPVARYCFSNNVNILDLKTLESHSVDIFNSRYQTHIIKSLSNGLISYGFNERSGENVIEFFDLQSAPMSNEKRHVTLSRSKVDEAWEFCFELREQKQLITVSHEYKENKIHSYIDTYTITPKKLFFFTRDIFENLKICGLQPLLGESILVGYGTRKAADGSDKNYIFTWNHNIADSPKQYYEMLSTIHGISISPKSKEVGIVSDKGLHIMHVTDYAHRHQPPALEAKSNLSTSAKALPTISFLAAAKKAPTTAPEKLPPLPPITSSLLR